MNNESFYMHPRFDEFTAFLKTLNTDAKITPSTKHLAFDVWLNAGGNMNLEQENDMLHTQVMLLKRQIDGLHKERDSFQRQANVLAGEVVRLNSMLVQGGAVGERGDACLSIDGGNL